MKRERQRILVLAGAISAGLVFLWFFVYIPEARKMNSLRSELKRMEKDINRARSIVGDTDEIASAITVYTKKIMYARQRFSSREEKALKALAKEADRSGLEVVSIMPGDPFENKSIPAAEGCICMELPISLELRGSYMKTGEYLGVLDREFPSAFRINNIRLMKLSGGSNVLSVSVDMSLYMVKPVSE